MSDMIRAFERSFLSLFNFRLWMKIMVPLFLVACAFVFLIFFFWQECFLAIQGLLIGSFLVTWLAIPFSWIMNHPQDLVLSLMTYIVLILSFVILFYVVQILIISQFLVYLIRPLLLESYQIKALTSDQTAFKSSVWTLLKTMMIYISGLILTFPLWVIPGLPFFISALWNGYLASRLLPEEILENISTPEQFQGIKKDSAAEHFGLGVIGALLFYVPFFNLIAPIFVTLLYMHYDLLQLEKGSQGKDHKS